MLAELLTCNESKTVEFKENLNTPLKILKTLVAFANTAGGTIVVGVEDKTKKIVGVPHVLKEEERLTNLIVDSVAPMLLPDIEVISHEQHELLLIQVPYLPGPYYLKQAGVEKGTFIRLGSTNRLADPETLATLLRVGKNISFDETTCPGASVKDIDEDFITQTFRTVHQKVSKLHYESLGLTASQHRKQLLTYGALLLFSPHRLRFMPDSLIRCVCYAGETREKIIDQKDISSNIIRAIDEIIAFIERHTNVSAHIGRVYRKDVAQFPALAVREAVVNAVVHADYAVRGTSVQIAVFKNRIEMTNPGALTFGQSLPSALAGVSKMRNRVIGRIFRELKIIERLGSGIARIFAAYAPLAATTPLFEEGAQYFRVTLFEVKDVAMPEEQVEWEQRLLGALAKGALSTQNIAKLWQVTERTARGRLKMMKNKGLIEHIAKSKTDPTATYQVLLGNATRLTRNSE